jgi:hypothetical protein
VEARDGILETPFSHEKGTLAVPDRPGLGFDINPRALKKFGKRFFVMDRKRLAWYSIRNRGLRATMEINRNRRRSRKK